MKQRALLIPILVAAIVASGALPVLAADAAIIQVSTEDIYMAAGQENSFKLVLHNTGDYNVFDVEAFITSSTPGLTILTDAHSVISEIGKGKTKTVEPTLYVDQNTALGAYTLTLNLVYRRFGTAQDTAITVPLSLVVNQGYTPKIMYRGAEGSGVTSGTEATATYTFENHYGETLHGIEMIVTSPASTITVLENGQTYIDELEPGETFTVTPTLSIMQGTTLGAYGLTATASYTNTGDDNYYQTFALPLSVDSERASKRTTVTIRDAEVSETIRPGADFNLGMTVEVTGADAYGLMAHLTPDATGCLSPLSPTTIDMGDVEARETAEAVYSLLARGDITAGQYPVTVTLSYTNSRGAPASLTETLTIIVDPMVDFQLLDTPQMSVARGGEAELEADLLLIGTDSVDFVSLEIVPDGVFRRVRGSEEYIGAVDPDSPIPFDLDVGVETDAEQGSHALTIRIAYRDHLNQEHVEEVSLPVEVTGTVQASQSTSQSTGIWGWLKNLLGI